jgi:membrane protease YdiL (CAAX protease family)
LDSKPQIDKRISWTRVGATVLVVAGAYLAFRVVHFPGLSPALAKLLLWLPLPLAAAAFMGVPGDGGALEGIGLKAPFLPALVPALCAGAVEFAVFAVAGYHAIVPAAQILFSGVLIAAVTEEILFRGFAVTQLAAAGLSTRTSIIAAGLLFGAAHIPNLWASGDAGAIAAEAAITAAGGMVFAVVMMLMNGSVVAAIALHFVLNLVWEVFAVSPDAIGNRLGLIARGLAILVAIAVGLAWRARARKREAG